MTRQEAFDKVWAGLKTQGFRRSDDRSFSRPVCLYRGPDGLKCAIGHLITDDEAECMGSLSISDSHARFLFRDGASLVGLDFEFCTLLQAVHDTGSDPHRMKAGLQEFAGLHRLQVPA